MESWFKIALEEERLKISSQGDQILKEASLSDMFKSIPAYIVSAVMAINSGMAEDLVKQQTTERYRLNQEQYDALEKTISNNSTVEDIIEIINQEREKKRTTEEEQKKLQQIQQQKTYQQQLQKLQNQNKINLDELVNHIITQEGLVKKQTPFKITHHKMRFWDTFLDFPILKGRKPWGRENFIFLRNPADVPKAIKQQFLEYKKNPSKYGLKENPTLGQAIRKFDQSNARGKISYLKKYMPNFNENTPLKDLI